MSYYCIYGLKTIISSSYASSSNLINNLIHYGGRSPIFTLHIRYKLVDFHNVHLQPYLVYVIHAKKRF